MVNNWQNTQSLTECFDNFYRGNFKYTKSISGLNTMVQKSQYNPTPIINLNALTLQSTGTLLLSSDPSNSEPILGFIRVKLNPSLNYPPKLTITHNAKFNHN